MSDYSLANSGLASRFGRTRGRILGGAAQGMMYPHPFFDLASTWTPTSFRSLFRWLLHYFVANGFINVVVSKLAEYPITDIEFEAEGEDVAAKWSEYMQQTLRYRLFQLEVGLDFFIFGNVFVSVQHPFHKHLTCKGCQYTASARTLREHWSFTGNEFQLNCPKCQHRGAAVVRDVATPSPTGVRLRRWDPVQITIKYDETTGNKTYYYEIPPSIRSDIALGRKDIVAEIPQVFIEAVKKNMAVILPAEEVYHMARPAPSGFDKGWGVPLLLPVLRDGFQMQILKKAHECVSPDTLLEVEGGHLLAAKDVAVGTYVRDHVGQLQRVVAKRTRPIVKEEGQFAVKLAISGLRSLPSVFSDNHPMLVLRRNEKKVRTDTKGRQRSTVIQKHPDLYDFQWVNAGDVRVGDYVGYPVRRQEKDQVLDLATLVPADWARTAGYVYSATSQDTAEAYEGRASSAQAKKLARRHAARGTAPKRVARQLPVDETLAYVAGWYLGDGSSGARRLDFSMGPEDDGVELSESLQELTGATPTTSPDPRSRGWRLTLSETIFSEVLSRWIPGKSRTKRIPREIMESPPEVVLSFLRGYLEADGHLDEKRGRVTVCCANQGLTYQLWKLCLSLGCIASLGHDRSTDTVIKDKQGKAQHIAGGLDRFHLAVTGESGRRLLSLLKGEAAPRVVSGKSGFFFKGYFAGRVSAAEVDECPEVLSFEVENSHTFCVPGMATHNTVLLEHLVPLRVIFPQPAAGTADPFTAVPLTMWKEHVAQELARFRWDPAYIPIMPLPIGQQSLGGDGKALMLDQQIQAAAEMLVVQLGVPKEIIFGGASWSGTNVSMRSVENFFLGYLIEQMGLLNFVINKIHIALQWPKPKARFAPFRMAEDMQRKQLVLGLKQMQAPMSWGTLLGEFGYNLKDELVKSQREAKLVSDAQAAVQRLQVKSQNEMAALQVRGQAQAQQEMAAAAQPGLAPGEPGAPQMGVGPEAMQQAVPGGPPSPTGNDVLAPSGAQMFEAAVGSQARAGQMMGASVPLEEVAKMYASTLLSSDPASQKATLETLRQTSPELHRAVLQILQQMQAQQATAPGAVPGQPAPGGVDMRPLPEQRPPRRSQLGG